MAEGKIGRKRRWNGVGGGGHRERGGVRKGVKEGHMEGGDRGG